MFSYTISDVLKHINHSTCNTFQIVEDIETCFGEVIIKIGDLERKIYSTIERGHYFNLSWNILNKLFDNSIVKELTIRININNAKPINEISPILELSIQQIWNLFDDDLDFSSSIFDFFSRDFYLCVNDCVRVPINFHDSSLLLQRHPMVVTNNFFVNILSICVDNDANYPIYRFSHKRAKMSLLGGAICKRVFDLDCLLTCHNESLHHLSQTVLRALKGCESVSLLSVTTCVLIHIYGPPRSGKGVLVSHVAQILGHRCVTISGADCHGQSSAAIDKKFDKIISLAQSRDFLSIHFRDFDDFFLNNESMGPIGGDGDGGGYDRRTIRSFEKMLAAVAANRGREIVLFVSTVCTDLPAEIERCVFVHFDAGVVSDNDRRAIIRGLMSNDLENKLSNDLGNNSLNNLENNSLNDLENKLSNDLGNNSLNDLENKLSNDLENKLSNDLGNNSFNDLVNDLVNMSVRTPRIELINVINTLRDTPLQCNKDYIDKYKNICGTDKDSSHIDSVTWRDIGGLGEIIRDVLATIKLILSEHKPVDGYRIRKSGILLYGAPGTGKTLLAKAVASECNLNFISVKGPELLNMYVGQTEENVRALFAKVKKLVPCLLFCDELDSIVPRRGFSGDSGGVMDRVVSQFALELDSINNEENMRVVVIGATNRPDLIDVALLRNGRFDRIFHIVGGLDKTQQLEILRSQTYKLKLGDDVNLNEIVAKFPEGAMTGAMIYGIVSGAIMNSIRRTIGLIGDGIVDDNWDLVVTMEDFMSAMERDNCDRGQ